MGEESQSLGQLIAETRAYCGAAGSPLSESSRHIWRVSVPAPTPSLPNALAAPFFRAPSELVHHLNVEDNQGHFKARAWGAAPPLADRAN